MRKTDILAVVAALSLVLAPGIESAAAQRGGGGQGGGAALDEETILEEFGSIVELIWSEEEEDAWNDLDDDDVEGKQAFIAAFWERRDPTPSTEDNEFREVWMARVAYANRTFRGEGDPGWETDRGQFYLIYGPEVVIEQETRQVAGAANQGVSAEQQAGTRQLITWTLDPTQNEYLEGREEIAFGQFQRTFSRTSRGFDYNQDAFLAGQAVKTYFEARRANPSAAGPAGGGGMGGGMAGAAASGAGTPTPDMVAMQELMQNGVTHDDLQLEQGMGYIPAADGNTFAMFNFELGKEGLTFESDGTPGPASMLAFGVLLKKDPAAANGEQFLRDVKINFEIDPSNGTAQETSTHSFGMTIEPGDYRLAWGVMDNASERITTTSYEFSVPDYTQGELGVPSVVIANGLEQMPDTIDINTVYPTTRVGNLALSTDLENSFGRNDSLLLLYFIRGLGVDPATQQPSFTVDHRILLAGTDDSIARLPQQPLNFGGIQQEIPLAQVSQLEAGTDYEIEIHIQDQVNGNEITQRVPFSVRGG
jgi:GWxTD domain-containing protein